MISARTPDGAPALPRALSDAAEHRARRHDTGHDDDSPEDTHDPGPLADVGSAPGRDDHAFKSPSVTARRVPVNRPSIRRVRTPSRQGEASDLLNRGSQLAEFNSRDGRRHGEISTVQRGRSHARRRTYAGIAALAIVSGSLVVVGNTHAQAAPVHSAQVTLQSTSVSALAAPVVGIAATPTGRGYWRVGADGGVLTAGDAHFYGSARAGLTTASSRSPRRGAVTATGSPIGGARCSASATPRSTGRWAVIG